MSSLKRTLKFVTGNKNKLREFNSLLGDCFIIENIHLDLPELQGEPEEIVREKCAYATELTDGPLIVEDTCLCFNAFGGLPGPYVKWFLLNLKSDGLAKLLAGFDDKTGYSLCTIAYSHGKNKPIKIFQGKTEGTIVEPRGNCEFGWDPCFLPDGYVKTFAEMTKEEKNKISHRGIAMRKLKQYIIDETENNINIVSI